MTTHEIYPDTPEDVYDKYYAEDKRKSEILFLEREIEIAEKRLKKADALLRLESNPDWVVVMQDGYMDEFAKNAIRGLGRGNIKKEELHEVLEGIGSLQTHLEGLLQLANTAKMELPRMRDELVSLKTVVMN